MPSPELLSILQDAWTAAPIVVAESNARRSESIPIVGLGGIAFKRCETHLPPFDTVESEDKNRHGWIRSECRQCGRFIGYRPVEAIDTIKHVEARTVHPKIGLTHRLLRLSPSELLHRS